MEYYEITGYLGSKLEEVRNLCRTYVKGMTHTGSRNLIYSLMEQKKVHLMELEDPANNRELSEVSFSDIKINPLLDGIGDFSAFEPTMDLADFLAFIEKRLICFYELYGFLAENCPEKESAYIFRRLEEEDRKQAALIRDRLDLFTLTS